MRSGNNDGSFEKDCYDKERKKNSFDSARKKCRIVNHAGQFQAKMEHFGKLLNESDEVQIRLEKGNLDVEKRKLALEERICAPNCEKRCI